MRVFFIVFLFILSSFPSFAVPDSFTGNPENEFDNDYVVYSSDIGDLNKDGIDDCVLILFQDTNEEMEEGEEEPTMEEMTMEAQEDQTEDADVSSKDYDVIVAIYFGGADGTYHLYNAWD